MPRRLLLAPIALMLMSTLVPSSKSLAQSDWKAFGLISDWQVGGTAGQCQSGYAMNSGLDQFSVGVASDGTYLLLQDLSWTLRPKSHNVMPVTVELDGSRLFSTEALVIGLMGMIQIVPRTTDMPEEEFWTSILAAKSMHIDGQFPASGAGNSPPTVDLEGLTETLPLLRECAQEYLPDLALPF